MPHTLRTKFVIAIVLITALLMFPAHQLFPHVGLGKLALWSLGGWLIVFAITAGLALIHAWWNQIILRKGGIDTQWLWFRRDPPGLERLRRPED